MLTINIEQLQTQLQAHFVADEIIKGRYWENGKGCAVGCATHSGDHQLMESLYGIPVQIAYLIDGIFEGLPNDIAKQFPVDFATALRDGADLSTVHNQFLAWLLLDPVDGMVAYSDAAYIRQVGELHQRVANGEFVNAAEWEASRAAAYAAYAAAYGTAAAAAGAAAYAAYAAADATATSAAYAAYGSAAAAGAAAGAAADAAYAAAYAAYAAGAAGAAAGADAARIKQAQKLVDLLQST